MTAKRKYGCDADVDQSFYVYLHKEKVSGTPFYVEKGKGKRAWSPRHTDAWREKVRELEGDYEVEIVEDNLSESDAHSLEIGLICKYKRTHEGGTLVNIEAGHGIAFVVGFPLLGDSEHARDTLYREITVEQKHELAQAILGRARNFATEYARLTDDCDVHEETDLEGLLDEVIDGLQSTAQDVSRRRATYRDSCDTLIDLLEDIEDEVRNPDEDANFVTLAREVQAYLQEQVRFVTAST